MLTDVSVLQIVAAAASTQACDSGSGVCVAFSIPSASSGNGKDKSSGSSSDQSANPDILVSIQAPGNLGWVGFGFGEQMTGSLVFPMWPNGDEVVVSARYASYFSAISQAN
jgi:Cytochrome domain of cellobiose dehydrogenase